MRGIVVDVERAEGLRELGVVGRLSRQNPQQVIITSPRSSASPPSSIQRERRKRSRGVFSYKVCNRVPRMEAQVVDIWLHSQRNGESEDTRSDTPDRSLAAHSCDLFHQTVRIRLAGVKYALREGRRHFFGSWGNEHCEGIFQASTPTFPRRGRRTRRARVGNARRVRFIAGAYFGRNARGRGVPPPPPSSPSLPFCSQCTLVT